MGTWATGKYAQRISDRSGMAFPYLEMVGVYWLWYMSYAIFMLISGIALSLRRLNDLKMGRSTVIVLFIPFIGFIFSLLLCVLPSAAKKRRR